MSERGGTPAASENAADIERRLEFMQLGEREQLRIRQLQAIVSRELPQALDLFYHQLRKSPEVRRFFGSEDHIEHAKRAQIEHWRNISAADFGADYIRKVRTIGAVHARIGLEPRWYIGGYAIILEHLIQQAFREFQASQRGLTLRKADAGEFGAALTSLVKAVLLDMDLAISVYIDEAEIAKKKAQAEAIASERDEVCGQFGKALEKVAEKDLTYRIAEDVPAAYAGLRDDFNTATDILSQTIALVEAGVQRIDASASELRQTSDGLAKRTEEQAASVEQTAAATEEITTTVKDTARRASEAMSMIAKARQGAEKSGNVVQRAIGAMGQIEQSSRQINSIIGVIDDIAFQTNLLALNAGVEAARAGEAGKGFAVVAQEVRELAQRSAEAARQIKGLIVNSANQVAEGVKLVGETGTSLSTIVEDVSAIATNIEAIAGAAAEQARALTEVSNSVALFDRDTQTNAAAAQQSHHAVQNLANEIAQISQSLAGFVIDSSPTMTKARDRRTG